MRGWIIEDGIEHESIELGFWQRIGTFEFNRVLCRENEKRFGELVRFALNRDAAFLHGFKQCSLSLRRRAIDFVRKNYIRKHRSPLKHQLTSARVGVLLHQERYRVQRVEQEVGIELGPERTRLRISLRGIGYDANTYPVLIRRLQEEIERQLFIKAGDTLGGEPQ